MAGPSYSFTNNPYVLPVAGTLAVSDLVAEFPMLNVTRNNARMSYYANTARNIPTVASKATPLKLSDFRGKKATVPSEILNIVMEPTSLPCNDVIVLSNTSLDSYWDGTVTYSDVSVVDPASNGTTVLQLEHRTLPTVADVLKVTRTTYTGVTNGNVNRAIITLKLTNRWGNYAYASINLIVKPAAPIFNPSIYRSSIVMPSNINNPLLPYITIPLTCISATNCIFYCDNTTAHITTNLTTTSATTATLKLTLRSLTDNTISMVEDGILVRAIDDYGIKSATFRFYISILIPIPIMVPLNTTNYTMQMPLIDGIDPWPSFTISLQCISASSCTFTCVNSATITGNVTSTGALTATLSLAMTGVVGTSVLESVQVYATDINKSDSDMLTINVLLTVGSQGLAFVTPPVVGGNLGSFYANTTVYLPCYAFSAGKQITYSMESLTNGTVDNNNSTTLLNIRANSSVIGVSVTGVMVASDQVSTIRRSFTYNVLPAVTFDVGDIDVYPGNSSIITLSSITGSTLTATSSSPFLTTSVQNTQITITTNSKPTVTGCVLTITLTGPKDSAKYISSMEKSVNITFIRFPTFQAIPLSVTTSSILCCLTANINTNGEWDPTQFTYDFSSLHSQYKSAAFQTLPPNSANMVFDKNNLNEVYTVSVRNKRYTWDLSSISASTSLTIAPPLMYPRMYSAVRIPIRTK